MSRFIVVGWGCFSVGYIANDVLGFPYSLIVFPVALAYLVVAERMKAQP